MHLIRGSQEYKMHLDREYNFVLTHSIGGMINLSSKIFRVVWWSNGHIVQNVYFWKLKALTSSRTGTIIGLARKTPTYRTFNVIHYLPTMKIKLSTFPVVFVKIKTTNITVRGQATVLQWVALYKNEKRLNKERQPRKNCGLEDESSEPKSADFIVWLIILQRYQRKNTRC